MSNYIKDPREMQIDTKNGVIYEEDNRKEAMYHWGGKIVDLCDLPVNEYMKPMTVITQKEPESGNTEIYYSFISKSKIMSYDDLVPISLIDAQDENGAEINIETSISQEYVNESIKFDSGQFPYDGPNASTLWEEYVEQYENENRYVFSIYIKKDIENIYTYKLFNVNAGLLVDASLVKTGLYKTFNSVEYAEYVNNDNSYLYDDTHREFKLRFTVN